MGATEKNAKWLPIASSLGVAFTPFCCEDGGFINAPGRALILEIAGNSGGTPAERTAFEIFAFRCVYATIQKGVAASILARLPMVSGCRVLPRGETLNLASLPLRRRTIPLSALTRLSLSQQQPPWALRAASAVADALLPNVDQCPMPDLPATAVSPTLRGLSGTEPRAASGPVISRRALDEAIHAFGRLAHPPPFVSVALAHATATFIPDSRQGPIAASTEAALVDPRLPSIFRAVPNSDEYGSTVEPSWLYHAQEPSLLPDGPSPAAIAVADAFLPIVDQYSLLDLPTTAVSPTLRESSSTVSRAANIPFISRRALDEAIHTFGRPAQPPPFVSVALDHATTTVIPDSRQGPNAAITTAALVGSLLPSIFRAVPNSDEYGSAVEPSWLYHAQEPSLLPDGPSLAIPIALPTHTRGAAP